MGFLTSSEDELKSEDVESKDLINFGLIPEFIGRIPIIATLNQLSIDDLIKVLSEPKNAITKQYQALFELDGINLEFTQDALETIAEMADEKGVGARGLRGIIEKIMLPLQYELPARDEVQGCIISKDFIQGKKEIELKLIDKKETN